MSRHQEPSESPSVTGHDLADSAGLFAFSGVSQWRHDLLDNRTTRPSQHDELYGHAEQLASWSQEMFLEHVHADDRSQVLAELAAATVLGSLDMTFRVVWSDGSERWLRSVGTTEYDSKGEAIQMAGVLIDVTDSKALEARVNELTQRQAPVSQLVGGVVHDFNNLLTVIVGASEALLATAVSVENRDLARIVLAASERAAEQTQRLLALTQAPASLTTTVHPATVVAEVVRLLRPSLPSGVDLHVREGGQQAVVVDRVLFESAILNLAMNSCAAVDGGGVITIRIDDVQMSNEVAISVADNGHGMTPDVRRRAFEPLYTTRAETGGTGLGLAQVQDFVRDSGGTVTIESEPGVGTVVTLLLPAAQFSAAEPPRDGDVTARGGTERLLLVEDDADVRRMALLALRGLGYHVRQASTAAEGWELIQSALGPTTKDQFGFDLVVANADTSGVMSSAELADRIRGVTPDLPVLLTGQEPHLHRPTPDSTVLFKPYRSSDLASLVRELLDSR